MGGSLRPAAVPVGWFALTTGDDLRAPVPASLAGRELVVWRDSRGIAHAHDAYCPHLGAHIGHGGSVDGDHLVCPFHGFRFGADGACVGSGYGTAGPPGAALGSVPVCEVGGIVFGWHGGEPTFALPALDATGWTSFGVHAWELPGHPQEVTENSVDVGHFAWVHGYRDLAVEAAWAADGATVRLGYGFTRPWVAGWGSRQHIAITVVGLGYSQVDVTIDHLPLRLRLLVLPTPLSDDRLLLRVALAVRGVGPVDALLKPLLLRIYAREVEDDFAIWKHKRYVERPMLAKGDGAIGPYRRWVRQFYPAE